MLTAEYVSPCGKLLIGAHKGQILLCDWMREGRIEETLRRISKYLPDAMAAEAVDIGSGTMNPEKDKENFLLTKAARQLDEYFAGRRKAFDLPLRPLGTDLQQRIWRELLSIPYGETITYREVAERSGRPSAVRAVASGIGANPLSILIPCHRVIATTGTLGGYAGGLDAKRYLLHLESKLFGGECHPLEGVRGSGNDGLYQVGESKDYGGRVDAGMTRENRIFAEVVVKKEFYAAVPVVNKA